MVESYKVQLKTAQADSALWKAEYEKEHNLRIQLIEDGKAVAEAAAEAQAEMPANDPIPTKEEAPEAPAEGETSVENEVEDLRKKLSSMKKDELIALGQESGLGMASVEGLTKKEIVEYILSAK